MVSQAAVLSLIDSINKNSLSCILTLIFIKSTISFFNFCFDKIRS